MRVLLIGGGGREHALAWKLKEEAPSLELLAAPGNPGIAELGECVAIAATDLGALEQLARHRAVDLTVVGPEAPLALGIVDRFHAAGLPIFGPTQAAAEIETSKAFAKQLMLDAGIPTARAEVHTKPAGAKAAARRFGAPVVVKASGLAAGKGVIVCETLADADRAIDDMLEATASGRPVPRCSSRNSWRGGGFGLRRHQRRGVRDPPRASGPQAPARRRSGARTPADGAYLPVSLRYSPIERAGRDHSLRPETAAGLVIFSQTLQAMAARGRPFTGLLYAGLMLTRDGPRSSSSTAGSGTRRRRP